MASLASSRTVSATVFLALIVTGWCLVSAVPVAANARRLQQLIPVSGAVGGLTGQLQALTSGLQKLSDQLQILLGAVVLPVDLHGQLQQVAASFALAQAQLQTKVRNLLLLAHVQPQTLQVLQDLLNQLATKLETVSKQFQNAQPVGGCKGCFKDLQASSVDAIRELTDKLKSSNMQPLALIAALGNLGNAVSQVDACAPGLQSLLSKDQGVLRAVGELVAGIQGGQKP
ncbi:hypothetical protein PVAP13_9NG210100 [Panicum virgatum]|uniref:Transmembrane protein n=1 Tax=Panicum virgatum TaxID=38727 RepID=A0A8T0MNB4_PANVG|nr:hypothetical protein PVAP13_9NG210100 [Panicum virgatum]